MECIDNNFITFRRVLFEQNRVGIYVVKKGLILEFGQNSLKIS